MRGISMAIVIAGVTLMNSITAVFAQSAGQAATAIQTTPTASAVAGTLTKFDPQTNTLTVSTAKGEESFVLSASTMIRDGAKRVAAANLVGLAGHQVRVRFSESGGQRTVGTVLVSPAPAKQATPAAQ
jgi:phage baseplate assembly protein gpV